MKSHTSFPYITIKRLALYVVSIIAVQVGLYLLSIGSKDDKDVLNGLYLIVPILGVWICVTKYVLYNLWYVYKIRSTGVAYTANVLTGVRRGGIDPTSPFKTELKGYDVTYVPSTTGHIFKRLGILFAQLFVLVLSTTILLYILDVAGILDLLGA